MASSTNDLKTRAALVLASNLANGVFHAPMFREGRKKCLVPLGFVDPGIEARLSKDSDNHERGRKPSLKHKGRQETLMAVWFARFSITTFPDHSLPGSSVYLPNHV